MIKKKKRSLWAFCIVTSLERHDSRYQHINVFLLTLTTTPLENSSVASGFIEKLKILLNHGVENIHKIKLFYHLTHSLAYRNSPTSICEVNPHFTTDQASAQLDDVTEPVNGRAG